MGIEKIREAVLSDAKKEAKAIVELAKKNSIALFERKKQEIDDKYERIHKTRIQEISDEFARKLIQFKGITNKKILEKRNALIDKIIQRAYEKVLSLPQERYMDLMARLIEKVASNTSGVILVHKEERDLFAKLIDRLNKDRDETARLVLDDKNSLPRKGGFIFIAKDYEINQTLDLLLEDMKKEMLPVIAKELFKDNRDK
ncbi:MAG TPA: V-type ATP synthase subunit E family protein [Syntrophorhabdaceae bacterium]|nr:V-type ATP synthase subunit E family protein [Syntrophorhabdaceae bacterium]HPP07411.1 V-type ATP synthase subunit E family protein [Syntrophorhabdaceae bacterium]